MMLHLLDARQQGLDPPWLLPKVYSSQRLEQLQLSKEKEFVRSHQKAINSLDIDEDGQYIISAGNDIYGPIVIHSLTTPPGSTHFECPVVARVFPGSLSESNAVSVVQWYPHDTGIFTTSSADQTLKIWDTNELKVVERFSFSKPLYTHSMAAAESHCLVAVGGSECKVVLCDLQSGSSTHILRGHRKPVMSLAWSPLNQNLLASGSQDNRIFLWDVRRATGPLACLDQHNGGGASGSAAVVTAHSGYVNGLCFTSDGLFLCSFGTDHRVHVWDAFTCRNTLINYGKVFNSLSHQMSGLCISSHSQTLSPLICVPTGSDVIMLEMLSGKKLRTLKGHYGKVTSCVLNPYTEELYSAGNDANVLAWSPEVRPPNRKPSSSRSVATASAPSTSASLSVGASSSSASRGSAQAGRMNVYEDAWSSEED